VNAGIWIGILIVLAVVIYAAGKVVGYMRQSEKQWEQVDKSKLKQWDEDDD